MAMLPKDTILRVKTPFSSDCDDSRPFVDSDQNFIVGTCFRFIREDDDGDFLVYILDDAGNTTDYGNYYILPMYLSNLEVL